MFVPPWYRLLMAHSKLQGTATNVNYFLKLFLGFFGQVIHRFIHRMSVRAPAADEIKTLDPELFRHRQLVVKIAAREPRGPRRSCGASDHINVLILFDQVFPISSRGRGKRVLAKTLTKLGTPK
jgi:hypothetical protein